MRPRLYGLRTLLTTSRCAAAPGLLSVRCRPQRPFAPAAAAPLASNLLLSPTNPCASHLRFGSSPARRFFSAGAAIGEGDGAKACDELLRTALLFSGLENMEATLVNGGIRRLEDLERAAETEQAWGELVSRLSLGEKEAEYLLTSLDLVSKKGLRIRNDAGGPLEKADDIFGDKKFMEGDFEDEDIDQATKDWLKADIGRTDDPEAAPVKELAEEKLPIFMRLNQAKKVASLASVEQVDEHTSHLHLTESLPEFIIIGRTNIGKSTMINHLLNTKKLVQASRKPGKTTCIDLFNINGRFTLADTPGYSIVKNQVSEKWESTWLPLVDDYLAKNTKILAGLFLMDIAKDVHPVDKQIVDLLKKHEVPVLLVLTKDDKIVDRNHRVERIRRIRKDLDWPEEYPHVRYTSFTSNRSSKNQRVSRIQMRKALAKLIALETRENSKTFLTGMESEAA